MNSLTSTDHAVSAAPSRRWVVWLGLTFLAWIALATAADEVLRSGFPVLRRPNSTNLPAFLASAAVAATVLGGARAGRALLHDRPSANAMRDALSWDWRSLVGGLVTAVFLAAALVGISVFDARQLQDGQLPLTARWQSELAGKPITVANITWQPDVASRAQLPDGLYLLVGEGRAVSVRPSGQAGNVFGLPRSAISSMEVR